MPTLLRMFSLVPTAKTCQLFLSSSTPFGPFPTKPSSTCHKIRHGTRTSNSKLGNFLDLKPEPKPEFLDLELPCCNPFDTHNHRRRPFDVITIGAGPAGLRLAEQVSSRGVNVCCIDPSPLSMWPYNYGVWVDEFETLNLQHCLDKTWPTALVYFDENKARHLDRPYGRVSRKELKTELIQRCIFNGVKFHMAKVLKIDHQEFESTVFCDDGSQLKASLVVDASGVLSSLVEYDKPRSNHGYQIAHGILAEVESHPFDLDKIVFMDWRDSHLGNEPKLRFNNLRTPTFLYAMPFGSNLIFLEETCLVSRPALCYREVKQRMAARLRHLGIKVKRILEKEKCFTLMGGPLPRIPQSVVAIGGSSGEIHPATGFMLARTMASATAVAGAIAECLGSTRMVRGKPLYGKVWDSLWPMKRRCEREAYCFGMETLVRLNLKGNRRVFDTFFALDAYYYNGFLSSRLTLGELALVAMSVFFRGSAPAKFDIMTKCPPLFVRMIANLALETI